MRYLLDTNVVSELRKPQADAHVVAWAAAQSPSNLHLSVITVYELELGVRRIERRDVEQGHRLREWLTDGVLPAFSGRILPLEVAVVQDAAALHVPDPRLERDCFLAATARVHGLVMVTRNVKDFEPTGVSLFDPWR